VFVPDLLGLGGGLEGLPDGRLDHRFGLTGLEVERLEASVLEGCAGGVFLVWRLWLLGGMGDDRLVHLGVHWKLLRRF
jgi:hypothetical protein